MRRKSQPCFNLLLSHLRRCSSDQQHSYFHSFRLVKLSQFLLLNPSSDHHSQCQSYSTGSSKLGSSSFFGSHFQSSKRIVLLGLVSLDDNNKLHRHHYSSHRSKVLYSLFLCVCVCWKFYCFWKFCWFLVVVVAADFFTRAKQVQEIDFRDEHR